MEFGGEQPICVLCCFSFPPPLVSAIGTVVRTKALDSFLAQTRGEDVDQPGLSAEGLLASHDASMCGDCFAGVARAAEKGSQLEEVEGQVRNLQKEILRLMHQVQGLMEGYLEEMRGLDGKISEGDEGSLKARFSSRRGRPKKGTWTKDNVFQFRNRIINIVKELSVFRNGLAIKFTHQPASFPVPEKDPLDLDDYLVNVKQEPEASQIPTFENECSEDPLGFASPPPSPPAAPLNSEEDEVDEDKDDSADNDFVPDGTTFRSPTRATRSARNSTRASRSFNLMSDNETQEGQRNLEPCVKIPITVKRRALRKGNTTSTQEESGNSSGSDTERVKSAKHGRRDRHVGYPKWATVIQKMSAGKPKYMSRFSCLSCQNFLARDKFHLEHHLRLHEEATPSEETKLLTCPHCPKTFTNEQYYDLHVKCHEGVFTSACDICWKPFSPMDLEKHMKEDHGAKNVYQCHNCIHVHSTGDRFLRHFGRHSGRGVVFGCGLCSDKFTNKRSLQNHLNRSHEEEDTMSKVPLSKPKQRFRKRIKPSAGNTKQSDGKSQSSDYSSAEENAPSEANPLSEQEPEIHKPRKRGRPFGTGIANNPDWVKVIPKVIQGKSKNFRHFLCVSCPDFLARDTFQLEHHLRLHESKAVEQGASAAFTCLHCPKTFVHQQYRDFHVGCHEGVFTSTCDICWKLVCPFNLLQHLDEHGAMNIYKCANCQHAHSTFDRYLAHLYRHSGPDVNVACGLCSEPMESRKTLREHMESNHVEADDTVGIIDKKIPPGPSLKWRRQNKQKKQTAARHTSESESEEDRPYYPDWIEYLEYFVHGKAMDRRYFRCLSCPEYLARDIFTFEHHLRVHESQGLGGDTKALTCLDCPMAFKNQQYYDFHVKSHEGMFRNRCDVCRKTFSPFDLPKHLMKKHGLKDVYKCANCHHYLGTRVTFMRHLERHVGGEIIWGCGLCSKVLLTKTELIQHLSSDHPEEKGEGTAQVTLPKKDEECRRHTTPLTKNRPDWYFKRVTELVEGRMLKRSFYKCGVCPDFRNKTMFRFDQHLRVHESEMPDDSERFTCSHCPASFRFRQLYEFHEACHDLVMGTCDACPNLRRFPVLQLKDHMEKEHGLTKIIQCGMCAHVYSTRDKYLRHLKNHGQREDNPVVVCDLCPETRKTISEILQHYQVHGFNFQNDDDSKLLAQAEQQKKQFAQQNDQNQEDEDNEEDEEDYGAEKPGGNVPPYKGKYPPWVVIDTGRAHVFKNEKRFTCVSCPNYVMPRHKSHYRLEEHLRHHERLLSSEEKQKLQCPHCPATFGLQQLLELHICQHQGLFPFICDLCRIPKSARIIREHLEKDHGVEKAIPCGNCSLHSSSREQHVNHLFHMHNTAESVYVCDLCNGILESRRSLVDHYQIEHDLTVKDEKYMERKGKVQEKIKRLAMETVMCPECGKSIGKRGLNMHIKTQHKNPEHRPFVCAECGKRWKTSGNLTSHMLSHQKEPSYHCHFCGKGFKVKTDFEAHVRWHEGKGLTCEQCGRQFAKKDLLRAHLKSHETKWYECDQCSLKYFDEKLLIKHKKKLHESGKEYKCEECGKAYPKPYYLRIHVRNVHRGERPYACEHCPVKFGDPGYLKAHMRIKHPEQWYSRDRKVGRKKQQSEEKDPVPPPPQPPEERDEQKPGPSNRMLTGHNTTNYSPPLNYSRYQ